MNKKMLYSLEKKILAFVLAFAMVATGLYILSPQAQEAKASEAVSTSSKTVKADTANQEMLSIKMQANEVDDKGTSDVTDDTVDLRIVSSVNGLGYSEVGFKVWFGSDIVVDENGQMEKEPTAKFHTTQVLERIKAGVEYNFSPKVIDTTSEYFVTGTLKGILQTNWNTDFYISAYCVSLDGSVTTEGVGRYFNVAEATSQSVINIPVAVDAESASDVVPVGGTVNVTVAEKLTTAVVESYIDGYAHLNVSVPSAAMVKEAESVNKELLPSASVVSLVALSDEQDIAYVELGYDTIYRNLESKYANKGAGDASWYSAYVELYQNTDKEPTAFTIATDADLYGLQLAVSQAEDVSIFLDKTFYLIADITVNEGTATSNWSSHAWTPISGFNTVFDGQGHTISGLYVATTSSEAAGFFNDTVTTTTIKSLNITNSYYRVNNTTGCGVVVGQGHGTFENIYADVRIVETSAGNKGRIGGIVGIADGNLTVRNCWNASDITSSGDYCGGILGNITSGGFNITIEDCLNTGNITSTYNSDKSQYGTYFGGLVGRANNSSATTGLLQIIDCLNAGIVTGEASGGYYGALLGFGSKRGTDDVATAVITNSCSAINYDENNEPVGVTELVGQNPDNADITTSWAADYTNLIDTNAFYCTELDFVADANTDGYWCVRENAMPMLVSHLTESDVVIDVSQLSKTSFTLMNNKGKIANLSQLESFRDQMNAGLNVDQDTVITLLKDIVVNEGTATSNWSSNAWSPITGFPGTFDGGGHTISGLYVTTTSSEAAGLFNDTVATTVIKNLSITNSYYRVNNTTGCGVVVGQGHGTLENIYADVRIVETSAGNKGRIGGIVGIADGDMTARNCWNASDITSSGNYCGGILGNASGSGFSITLEYCLNTGDITSTTTTATNHYFGGLVGRANGGNSTTGLLQITDCLSTGIVSGTATSGYWGALLGFGSKRGTDDVATAVITNSYSAINYGENNEPVGVTEFVGQYPDNVDTITSSAVDYDNLLGTAALTNAPNLDYVTSMNADGHWVAREGATPMLATFLSDTDTVVTNE